MFLTVFPLFMPKSEYIAQVTLRSFALFLIATWGICFRCSLQKSDHERFARKTDAYLLVSFKAFPVVGHGPETGAHQEGVVAGPALRTSTNKTSADIKLKIIVLKVKEVFRSHGPRYFECC